MTTVHKTTINLTDQESEWVQNQIASGQYADDSAYFRDLVRRDREYKAKLDALRKAVKDGFESGVSDRTLDDAWAEGLARYKARRA